MDDIILQFVARKQEFLIPAILILRSLSGLQSTAASEKSNGMGITDEELYRRIVQGNDSNTFLKARAELLLQDARARYPNLNTPEECLSYIGSRFRRLSLRADTSTDMEVGHYMIRRYVLIHLPTTRTSWSVSCCSYQECV